MKITTQIIFYSLVLGSCTSEKADVIIPSHESHAEEMNAAYKAQVYPITITHRNIKELSPDNERIYSEYDSLEITLLNDSCYFFRYYRNGKPTTSSIDTLLLPSDVVNYSNHSIPTPGMILHSPGKGERLITVELDEKQYQIIERRSSCCSIWKPMGHEHYGSISYFSLNFGWIARISIREKLKSNTIWIGDWDRKLVNELIEQLPVNNKRNKKVHNINKK